MKSTFSRLARSNKWHIHEKNLNFLFIIYNFKRDIFIHIHTLRHSHSNDDIA